MQTLSMVMAAGAGLLPGPVAAADTLYDNGGPNGVNGYSNTTRELFGFRRTVLDDFTVPADVAWTISEFHWHHVWNTIPILEPWAELTLWSDADGQPGMPIQDLPVTSYMETGTGNTYFSRPERESWASFDSVTLSSGVYWIEWTTARANRNSFALTADRNGTSECWVNYEDLGGLQPGSTQFGVEADLAWSLQGIPGPGAIALLGLLGMSGGGRRRRGAPGCG